MFQKYLTILLSFLVVLAVLQFVSPMAPNPPSLFQPRPLSFEEKRHKHIFIPGGNPIHIMSIKVPVKQ